MTQAAVVLASVAVYLTVGWRLAMRDLPQAWVRARKNWVFDDSIRDSVKCQTVSTLLAWPMVFTVYGISHRLNHAIDAGDPETLAAKVAERDLRISELERELGIR